MSRAGRPRDRRIAEEGGRTAETIAALWLILHGWRVLARRYKSPVGEIDLIVRRGRVLAFIEVKARLTAEAAAEAVLPRQQERITRAAQAFLQARADLAAMDARFDVVLVTPMRLPVHLVNAWHILG